MKTYIYYIQKNSEEHNMVSMWAFGKREEAEKFFDRITKKADEVLFIANGSMTSDNIPTTFLDCIEDGECFEYVLCELLVKD